MTVGLAVKNDAHGSFTTEMIKLPQPTWIVTFLEGVTKSAGQPLFSELACFTYKVSGVMCSASASENYWSIQGWIHSERRNKLDQKLVEKLIRSHTNLVMRESLDDTQRHLLPWDIEFVIDEVVDEHEVEKRRGRDSEEEGGGGRRGGEEFKCGARTCVRVWVDPGNNPSDSFFKHVSGCGYYECLADDCLSLFETKT
jgi:hypothetical protein